MLRFTSAQRRAGGVEFGTAMRCAALLRLSRARPDFNYVSILERGKLPHKGVVRRAHWTPGGLRSLAHTYAAPRGGMYPEPIGRRTGCGEFKERTLRLRTEVEGTAQRIGRRYGRILERNPALADRLRRRFQVSARHMTESRG